MDAFLSFLYDNPHYIKNWKKIYQRGFAFAQPQVAFASFGGMPVRQSKRKAFKCIDSQFLACTFFEKTGILKEKGGKNMNQQKVGSFLKKLRNEKSITQAELAEGLGVSNRSISRWENGTTMPDFDLLIELAQYYGVEVGEILDGERRAENMEVKQEELMVKVADYQNVEKNFFSKRMCTMFILALLGMGIYIAIDLLGLSAVEPYETIVSIALGFNIGTLLTGLLYASRYLAKLKEAKARLMRILQRK